MWGEHFDLAERLMDRMLTEARRNGSAVGLTVASSMRSLLHFRRGALPTRRPTPASPWAWPRRSAARTRSSRRRTRPSRSSRSSARRPHEELERLTAELEDPALDTDALPYELVLHSRGCLRVALGDDRGGLEDLLAGGRFPTAGER